LWRSWRGLPRRNGGARQARRHEPAVRRRSRGPLHRARAAADATHRRNRSDAAEPKLALPPDPHPLLATSRAIGALRRRRRDLLARAPLRPDAGPLRPAPLLLGRLAARPRRPHGLRLAFGRGLPGRRCVMTAYSAKRAHYRVVFSTWASFARWIE